MILALIGNQNCGKTTLFNQLTGSNQHVGNFPGVTVDSKEGLLKRQKDVTVVDLPGIYSLSPYTSEEIVTRDFLIERKPDAIINIIDATNLERNLYLSLQLMEMNIPMVLALNMMDEVRNNGGTIDIGKMSQEVGLPVVPISASKNEGVQELVDTVITTAEAKAAPKKMDFCHGPVHKAIHALAHVIEDQCRQEKIPPRFAATKLIEGDEPTMKRLGVTQNQREIAEHLIQEMETALGTDKDAALADMRYDYIEELCAKVCKKKPQTKEQLRSIRIDSVLTHKIWAIPIFLGIMAFVFWMTFGVIGAFLSDIFSKAIEGFTMLVDKGLTGAGVNDTLQSLIIDGVCAGVGSVLSFLPTIVTLFFFLSLLEDSGYMARVAFVMDKLLRKIGLSGRSFVPMLIGFGCSVPAIMATRTLSSERDRKMTILLTPFMSCSAKLPIYAVFTAALFPKNGAVVMIGLYIFGILVGVGSGLLMKNTLFKGNPVPFVMELPSYRFPSPKTVLLHMWEKAKDFIKKAFTIIFLATIVIWLLQSFDFRFNIVADSGDSMLAAIGKLIAPVFAPLGFGDWKASTALLTGLTAKETVVSTLSVLTGATGTGLSQALQGMFTPLSAMSFLVFVLLYMPCVAAMAAVKRELGSARHTAGAMLYQTLAAWIAAFLVYQIGSLILGVA